MRITVEELEEVPIKVGIYQPAGRVWPSTAMAYCIISYEELPVFEDTFVGVSYNVLAIYQFPDESVGHSHLNLKHEHLEDIFNELKFIEAREINNKILIYCSREMNNARLK